MGWDTFTFLEFLIVGFAGATAGFLTLLLLRKRSTVAKLDREDRRMSVAAFSGSVAAGICIGAMASALISLLPHLWGPERLGDTNGGIVKQIKWQFVVAFISMLLGMAASYFNRLINERRARIEELRRKGDLSIPGLDFDAWDFVQPFFVALITFGAIIARVNEADTITNVLLGFQTGFFWQTVLANRGPQRG